MSQVRKGPALYRTIHLFGSFDRMDFDATAIPWFLEPQWNTSAWAQHVARYGPSGVHDHKARDLGQCLGELKWHG